MRIILRNDRHNRHTRLHSKMKSPLLKRQQRRLIRITPRPLGEDKNTLPMRLHLPRSTLKRLQRRLAIRPIDKHRPRKRHEPAQQRHVLQRLLRRHAAVGREDGAQHEHVELALVVSDEYGGAGGEVFDAVNDLELDARGVAHDPAETARGGPLRYSAVADEAEAYRRNYSVGGAED